MALKPWLTAAVLIVTTLTPVTIRAITFYSTGGTARVIDAQSGQPVEGVIVEASWQITHYRDPAAAPLAELLHAEAQTNANGEFTLPAWGPVTTNLRSYIKSVVKWLDHSQPHLYFHKRGYGSTVEKGPDKDPRPFLDQLLFDAKDRRIAWWDQHTFKLEPDRGSVEQRRGSTSPVRGFCAGSQNNLSESSLMPTVNQRPLWPTPNCPPMVESTCQHCGMIQILTPPCQNGFSRLSP